MLTRLSAGTYRDTQRGNIMFPFDLAALPQLTTRKALLVVDFQRDFLSVDDGALPVTEPEGFAARTLKLAEAVRRAGGDVVWVQSRFEQRRDHNAEPLVASDAALAARPSHHHRARVRLLEHQEDDDEADEEAFLSHDPPRCVKPSTSGVELASPAAKEDSTLWKSHYSAFLGTSLLRLLRAKMVMEVFICGSLANVGVYATALDAAGHGLTITVVDDCCGFGVAARKRKALRNLDELTGCEVARCADVVKALHPSPPPAPTSRVKAKAQNKTTTTSSTKAAGAKPESGRPAESELVRQIAGLRLAERSPSDAGVDEAQRQDAAPTAEADSQSSQNAQPKLQERAGNGDETARRSTKSNGKDGLDDGQGNVAATPKPHHQAPTEAAPVASPKDKTGKAPRPAQSSSTSPRPDKSSPRLARGVIMSGLEDKIAAASEPDHSDDEQPTQHAPQKGLGAGDTDIIENLLPPDLEATMFDRLRDEVQWQRMSHQGGEVPRLVAVQGQVSDDDGGSMPVYRHPSDESPPLLPFSPAVLEVKAEAEKHLGHPLNHVLIQYYRDGNDYISEHSDKSLDIVRGSYIANVSLGAERTMVLRTKRQHKDPSCQAPQSNSQASSTSQPAEASPETKRQAQRLRLHHNSMCRMGLATNEQWLHAIRQDRRAERDKTPAELARAGARISLTFRQIGTFLSRDESLIWGQGATGKTRAEAHPVVNGQGPEAVAMLRAFGTENHASRFDWAAHYGAGFDVLHISNSPRFFASATDAIVNMRIALMLAEYGVNYAKGSMAPTLASGGKGSEATAGEDGDGSQTLASVPVKFVDNDAAKSVVQGDLAIMLYLDAVYGQQHRDKADAKSDVAAATSQSQLAAQYTLFQRALQLLGIVRRNTATGVTREGTGAGADTTDAPPVSRVVRHELSTVWETAAKDGALCGTGAGDGKTPSLADFALWPVLHALADAHGGPAAAFAGMDHLRRYYEAFAERHSARVVLGRGTDEGADKETASTE
ncbi:isochorismatase family protein family [Purpureocillium lilacinum]|uniref:Isochorismatase family protein family n=2 Tax=Purpureocillium lilacinum TaxID=33203 RepID=A0A179GCI6_PURLI|nr:isochorismatase family protein family [Purpureocillium lilacinum]